MNKRLLQSEADTVLTRMILDGEGPVYVFSSADADVIVTEAKTIGEIYEDP